MGRIRIYRTKIHGVGWEASDATRSAKSARTVARGYPDDTEIRIVKTGEKGYPRPYIIYTRKRKSASSRLVGRTSMERGARKAMKMMGVK